MLKKQKLNLCGKVAIITISAAARTFYLCVFSMLIIKYSTSVNSLLTCESVLLSHLTVVQSPVYEDLSFCNVSRQIGNGVGDIIVRHS